MAVAHSMLIAIYHVLKEDIPFHDLGADYYDGFRREHKIRSYLSLFAPCHTKLHHKLLAVSFSARFKYSTAARSLLR